MPKYIYYKDQMISYLEIFDTDKFYNSGNFDNKVFGNKTSDVL